MVSFKEFLMNEYIRILIKALIMIVFAFIFHIATKAYFRRLSRRALKKKSIEDRRIRQTRLDFFQAVISTSIFIITTIFILFLFPSIRTFSYSLLAGAGVLAIIIGFAAQKTLANIFSGLSIAIFTPFRIGDRLKIGEELGDVEDLSLRHTVVRTWDNRRIIIPNSIISEREIVNYSLKEERLLWTVNMGISYDSDIDKAKKIMLDLANKHPNVIFPEIEDQEGVIQKREPNVRVTECGDFAVNLRLYFWVESPNKAWVTAFDLIEQIKKEFDKKGIEIPFPYRTIVYKKDLEKKKGLGKKYDIDENKNLGRGDSLEKKEKRFSKK